MLPREYAREALKRGLAYDAKFGVNPFKFGVVGSTDSHTSLVHDRGEQFLRQGDAARAYARSDPVRGSHHWPHAEAPRDTKSRSRASARGLAAVWARDNTREALWDAMARKEVFATTGTRLIVRVFAGFDFPEADLDRSNFAEHGYASGVPMGGDLKTAPAGKAPTLLVRALRDAGRRQPRSHPGHQGLAGR